MWLLNVDGIGSENGFLNTHHSSQSIRARYKKLSCYWFLAADSFSSMFFKAKETAKLRNLPSIGIFFYPDIH